MPRRREVIQRVIQPDSKYNSVLVAKFINTIMSKGKKSIAEKIVYDAFYIIAKKIKEDKSLSVFEKAIENVKPTLEVKSRRIGGSTYQVPSEIKKERRVALAIRWIIGFAKKRSEKSMAEKLSGEFVDAYNNKGSSVKKKEDTHKMAEANKAFAHYRW